MPGSKPVKKAKSKAQAGLAGAVIAGKSDAMKKELAREMLRGVKVSRLPRKKGNG